MTASNLCQQFAEKIAQFRARALDQELTASFEAHCESCQACGELLKKDKALDALFSIPEEPSSEQKAALEKHIESLSVPEETPIPWIWVGTLSAIVVATVIASWSPSRSAPKEARQTWRQQKGLSSEDMPEERYRDTRG